MLTALRRTAAALALAAIVCLPGSLPAQEEARHGLVAELGNLGISPKALKDLLGDPETLNWALDRLLKGKAGRWQLLKDLNLRFATFQAEKSDARGLGLSYDYSRSIKHEEIATKSANYTALGFDLSAAGNISFDRRINPRDFLQSDLALSVAVSRGGAYRTTPAIRERLAQLRDSLALIESQEELDHSPLWAEYLGTVQPFLSTQLLLDLAATASFETDQGFDDRQLVYAGRLGLDLKAWNNNSTLARWNVFDWPFATLRYLIGTDSAFAPRGATWPTVQASLGLVDPVENDPRNAVASLGAFPRFKVEAAFRTPIASRGDNDVNFESDFRWYRELGAPAGVRTAGLDEFTYFAAAITTTLGPFVSFSAGRLPFDAESDRVYQLGFRTTF
ncbi:MAG TPA: hypothetical protein VLD58_06020 [Gemmatimonadales bacterium]|nr:hypothetical protein [Gemmatimonadales bacterium]